MDNNKTSQARQTCFKSMPVFAKLSKKFANTGWVEYTDQLNKCSTYDDYKILFRTTMLSIQKENNV